QYFVLFAGLGIPLYGNRQIAYVRDSNNKLSVNFWEILILEFNTVIISLFSYLLFIFYYQFDEKYLLIQSLYIIAVFFDISWLFMGIEDFKKIVIRNTLVKFVTVAA
ncbi:flippase, partial [Bifidobacterium pseudocatenulatum]|nr:flippase [Bifidobacterium pseudocatenulatum]